MATSPWRCSECGTINEPVANSCRTCGRWPSLFDLEESAVEEAQVGVHDEPRFEVGRFETETFEPQPFEPQPFEVEPQPTVEDELDVEPGEAEETEVDRRRRLITSLIVPLAFVAYIVISIIFGDR